MPLSTFLSKSKFYQISGVTPSEVNDDYVDSLISSVNQNLAESLGGLFQLTTNQTFKYYMQNSPSIVLIGTWQKASLVVKKGSSDSISTLTENSDYICMYPNNSRPMPGKNYPVIAIKLLTNRLYSSTDYLQIEGTYGVKDGIPADLMLDQRLYSIIKRAALSNQIDSDTGGMGAIASSQIDKIKTEFAGAGNSGVGDTPYISQDKAMYLINNLIKNIASDYDFSDMIPQVIG